jgi:hypothetical protein
MSDMWTSVSPGKESLPVTEAPETVSGAPAAPLLLAHLWMALPSR